jgi:hypothetical protein
VSIAAADLDRDGWIDLATGSNYTSLIEIRAWDNDKTPFGGGWSSVQVVDLKAQNMEAQSANSLSVADLDGDGWPDIAAGLSWSSVGRVGVWRNPGAPFATRWPLSVTMGASDSVLAVATGDLDHDGDVDVASVTYPSQKAIAWWENDGSPFDAPWSVRRFWPAGMGAHDLLLADLNKNADLDTVVSGEGTPKVLALLAQWQRIYLPAAFRQAVPYFAGPGEREPNDSIAQANGALVSGQDYYGYPDDAEDFYGIYLRRAGRVDVALSSTVTAGLELSLWHGAPAGLVGWDGNTPYNLSYDGTAGWYYVRVYHAHPVTTTAPYTLRVTYP